MTKEELVEKLNTKYYGISGNLKTEWVNHDKYGRVSDDKRRS